MVNTVFLTYKPKTIYTRPKQKKCCVLVSLPDFFLFFLFILIEMYQIFNQNFICILKNDKIALRSLKKR